MADPQLVLVLLPPAHRRRRAADLEHEIVLVAARTPGRPRSVPFAPLSNRTSTDARSSTVMSTTSTSPLPPRLKRLARAARLLARRDDGRDVAEHVRDAQAGHVLRQVAPVRADVAERRRGAALRRVEPPRVVGVLEQPVLQVVAVHEVRRADVAAGDGLARLLHERVAAVVEGDGGDDAGAPSLRRRAASIRAAVIASGLSETTCLPLASAADVTS